MQIDLSVFIFAPNLGNSDNAKIYPVQPHLFYAKKGYSYFFLARIWLLTNIMSSIFDKWLLLQFKVDCLFLLIQKTSFYFL